MTIRLYHVNFIQLLNNLSTPEKTPTQKIAKKPPRTIFSPSQYCEI
jgi:hypothetical protein